MEQPKALEGVASTEVMLSADPVHALRTRARRNRPERLETIPTGGDLKARNVCFGWKAATPPTLARLAIFSEIIGNIFRKSDLTVVVAIKLSEVIVHGMGELCATSLRYLSGGSRLCC